ncbi:MAG: hypothetical protein IPM81_11370 [Saprospirales bacterium]|nr:hypothetical protein [Saprospirales bacterium]
MFFRRNKLVLWLWMAALLASTIGISVQQIYCYCAGKTTVSIFREAPDACAAPDMAAPDACCKAEVTSCCAKKNVRKNNEHDCTKKTVKVFQLKTEFIVGHPLDLSFDFPMWADELPEILHLYRPALCTAEPANKAPPIPPPPVSGRMICLRHEVFRC